MSLINKFLAVLLLLTASNIWAQRVVSVENLVTTKQLAASKDKAILIMFSASDCPYCVVMEEDFLDPMLINPDSTDAIIRKVEIDDPGDIIDFNGEKISIRDFATKLRIRVTPTLLFFDTKGQEKAGRIIGTMTRDYLGLYIDNKIELVKYRMTSKMTNMDNTTTPKINEK